MAGKISEYPVKTVFNDTDLMDISTAGTASEKMTYAQLKADLAANLAIFTDVANGIVPLSGGGTTNFLRADGTWAAAGADGNGIYDASGSLSGATTITMGTNNLTFASTGDANLLQFDTTNNRLGIGISTPSAKLHVVGDTQIDGDLTANLGTGTAAFASTTDALNFKIDGSNGHVAIGSNTLSSSKVTIKSNNAETYALNMNTLGLGANSTSVLVTSRSASGTNIGIHATSQTIAASQSIGVKGEATGTVGNVHYGVVGTAQNATAVQAGVRGEVLTGGSVTPSGTVAGVIARCDASLGTELFGLFSQGSVSSAGSTFMGVYSQATNGGTGTTTAIGGYFEALTATNSYAIVTPSGGGNVGLGTITPTEQLDVNGRQFMSNQTAPSTPTGGGTIYVEAGALKYIGSNGTITTLGIA